MKFGLRERQRRWCSKTIAARPSGLCSLLSLLPVLVVLSPNGTLSVAQEDSPSAEAVSGGGSLSGTVKDRADGILARAKVTLLPAGPNLPKYSVSADPRGAYAITAVVPGTYTLEVESRCFRQATRPQIVIHNRERRVADFTLDLDPKCAPIIPDLIPDHPIAVPADNLRGSNAPAKAESLGGFTYYDDAKLKSAGVSASVDPGGYSAAGEVDSYSLMLEYVEAEGAAVLSDSRQGDTPGGSSHAPAGFGFQPTSPELDAWSESQFLARGSDLLRHHDLVASIEVFQAGVARFPDSARLRTGLGIALSARGDYENAVASLLRATDLAPSDPRPYFVLAKLYRGPSAQDDQVPKRLQRLVTLDPRNPRALYYYSLTLAKGIPGDDAALKQISLLKRALDIDPNLADAHLQLGIVYAALSNYPDAIREYQSAVRLKPDLVAAHYRLAQAYERAGEKAAAQAELDLSERLRKQTSTNPR